MKDLKGTKTHTNLKEAFAGERQANRRYLNFGRIQEDEGHPDIAGLFRDTAEGETGHAHGHLDYLKSVGDPATDQKIGDTSLNLKSAVHGETYEYTNMYPGMAKTARGRLPRERGQVRNAGQGRKIARGTLREGAVDDCLARPPTAFRTRPRRRSTGMKQGWSVRSSAPSTSAMDAGSASTSARRSRRSSTPSKRPTATPPTYRLTIAKTSSISATTARCARCAARTRRATAMSFSSISRA